MRAHLLLVGLAALAACRRPHTAPATDDDLDASLAPGQRDAGAPSACRVLSRQSVVRGAAIDAGEGPLAAFESTRVVLSRRGRRLSWVDARASRMVLGGDSAQAEISRAMGPGEHSDPSFEMIGAAATPAVAWTHDTFGGRRHVVRWGASLERGCAQAETRDEGLSITTVSTARGLLVAWDDDGPRPAAGSVKLQLIEEGALRAVPNDDALPACPAPRQISAPEQDASDPVLAPAPDGGAVLAWLTARDVDATQANDTVTDLWAQSLGPDGQSVGVPLRLTNALGHRFGVSVSVGGDGGTWVAFRVADETDSESRGDGGDVVVVRAERSAEGLRRASDPFVVTRRDITPSGAPQVFATRDGAQVFLRHRQGQSVTTLARTLQASQGSITAGALRAEPALAGRLPSAQETSGHLLVPEASGAGALDLLRVRCELR